MDQLKEKDRIEALIQSLSRFSEKVLLILSGKTDVSASAKKIGPALIFQRLWEGLGIEKVLKRHLSDYYIKKNPAMQAVAFKGRKTYVQFITAKSLRRIFKRIISGIFERLAILVKNVVKWV